MIPEVKNCHDIIVYKEGSSYSLTFHCTFPPMIKISDAHRVTAEMERRLHQLIPEVDRIYIHQEPLETSEK